MGIQEADSEFVHVCTTSEAGRLVESTVALAPISDRASDQVVLHPEREFQQLVGFGGAVTETVAQLYWGLAPSARKEFLREHFSVQGRNYRLVRTPVQSCDFGPGPHSYINHFWQNPARTFDTSVDEAHVIPLLAEIAAFNPSVEFVLSPWSPPAFMKTNHCMRFGGHLKARYEDRWAQVIALYARKLRDRGVPVRRLTVQNEPCARQVWESCLMDAAQEVHLARKIRAQLAAVGIDDVKILAWDHNKDLLVSRFAESQRAWGAEGNPFDGWAFHWYAGDHFDAVAKLAQSGEIPELLMTEGCEYFSTDPVHRREFGEHYAHDIIGDLNAGTHGWIDWNIMLDEHGGPTYVRNFCSAPVEADAASGSFTVLPSADYIYHFAHFIEPGARRIDAAGAAGALELTAWKNPDGKLVCVVLNRTDAEQDFSLCTGERIARMSAAPHSIQTITWE